MKKVLVLIICLLGLVVFSSFAEDVVLPEYTTAEYSVPFATTLDAIDGLKVPCEQQGTIESLSFEAPAYAINEFLGLDKTIARTVQVYLPFGYSEEKQYNILYLIHGTGGKDTYWFFDAEPDTTRNVLDNMIQQGLCEPLIVVTPEYTAEIKGKETRIKDELVAAYAQEHQDSFLKVRNDLWPEYFHYELENDIIPLVESRYSTYANKDISPESLAASREHRAIAGLSRGSMTAMRAGMIYNLDKIAWFGNYSGIWLDFEKLEAALAANDSDIKFWYNGTGTKDSTGDAAVNQLTFHNQVTAKLAPRVEDGRNYCMIVKDGGAHDFASWIVDLYNSLLVFFK